MQFLWQKSSTFGWNCTKFFTLGNNIFSNVHKFLNIHSIFIPDGAFERYFHPDYGTILVFDIRHISVNLWSCMCRWHRYPPPGPVRDFEYLDRSHFLPNDSLHFEKTNNEKKITGAKWTLGSYGPKKIKMSNWHKGK